MTQIASKILQLKEQQKALIWQQNRTKTQQELNQLANLRDHQSALKKSSADLMRNNSYFKQRLNEAIRLQTKNLKAQRDLENIAAKNWQEAYAKLNAYHKILQRKNKLQQIKINNQKQIKLDELVLLN